MKNAHKWTPDACPIQEAAGQILDDAEEWDFDGYECPLCGGPGMVLGTLGQRTCVRCRNCGIDYSREAASA